MKKGPPFAAVVFDCDSTLTSVEGIDELGRRAGFGRDIQALTTEAMEGRIPLEDIYAKRLEQIRPSKTAVRLLGNLYVSRMVPGAGSTIATLKRINKKVFIASGGIREAVEMLAAQLDVPGSDVYAVELKHDEHGQYLGYKRSPLTKSSGKVDICTKIAKKYGPTVLIGDGMTDLAVSKAGIEFVGFGGVIQRPMIKEKAKAYVPGPTISPLLKIILTEEEIAENAAILSKK